VSEPTTEEMLEFGRVTGRVATRLEAEQIIRGLMESVRSLRELGDLDNPVIWRLMAAVEGIRETMPKSDG
jgi:hypothetical protein